MLLTSECIEIIHRKRRHSKVEQLVRSKQDESIFIGSNFMRIKELLLLFILSIKQLAFALGNVLNRDIGLDLVL